MCYPLLDSYNLAMIHKVTLVGRSFALPLHILPQIRLGHASRTPFEWPRSTPGARVLYHASNYFWRRWECGVGVRACVGWFEGKAGLSQTNTQHTEKDRASSDMCSPGIVCGGERGADITGRVLRGQRFIEGRGSRCNKRGTWRHRAFRIWVGQERRVPGGDG